MHGSGSWSVGEHGTLFQVSRFNRSNVGTDPTKDMNACEDFLLNYMLVGKNDDRMDVKNDVMCALLNNVCVCVSFIYPPPSTSHFTLPRKSASTKPIITYSVIAEPTKSHMQSANSL